MAPGRTWSPQARSCWLIRRVTCWTSDRSRPARAPRQSSRSSARTNGKTPRRVDVDDPDLAAGEQLVEDLRLAVVRREVPLVVAEAHESRVMQLRDQPLGRR